MISVGGLSVELEGTRILSELDLTVGKGSWTSVIGPNGSGKTTLLRAVAGLVPFSGDVLVDGRDLKSMSHKKRAKTASYVPQNPVIPREMPVRDYVLLGRTPYISYLGTESRNDLAVVAALLERVNLQGLSHRRLGSLSGGELQRAVLARSLAQEARVLLLDEPTTGLDLGYQQQVLELVDSLRAERGLTVLAAIHDLTLAGQFSEQLVLIDSGIVCSAGDPREVLTEELVAKHYGAPVSIVELGGGGFAVIPVRGV